MKLTWMTVGMCCAVLVAGVSGPVVVSAAGYDVEKNSQDGTAIPDVDKAGIQQGMGVRDGNPGPAGDDYGCWAATAANVLGGAGWGINGTAQQKADQIYQDLINNFKVAAGDTYLTAAGSGFGATKWWVHNIGLDQADSGNGYTPGATYVNFRRVERTLLESDYNYLLNELDRCQYAGVSWWTGGDTGHSMTLVGGNYGPNGPIQPPTQPQESIWHNSDEEGIGLDDEFYANPNFAAGSDKTWKLDYWETPQNPNDDWIAEGYFTACPGVPKPVNAIDTFDVHRYIGLAGDPTDPDQNGVLDYEEEIQQTTTGQEYGNYAFPAGGTEPYWEDQAAEPTLFLPNESVQDKYKKLYILVDFNDPLVGPEPNPPDIQVFDDDDVAVPLDSAEWSSDLGQVLLTYVFEDQPDFEKIVFPSDEYVDLMNAPVGETYNVLEWNIATECVPEPATMALLACGAGVLVWRRRRRR